MAPINLLVDAATGLVAFTLQRAWSAGVKDLDAIAERVKAVAPKSLDVLLSGPGLSVAELAGVRYQAP